MFRKSVLGSQDFEKCTEKTSLDETHGGNKCRDKVMLSSDRSNADKSFLYLYTRHNTI